LQNLHFGVIQQGADLAKAAQFFSVFHRAIPLALLRIASAKRMAAATDL